MDPITEFIAEQQHEGRWDSHGHFTTAANKALSKLASYQLPRPAAWVLKMVQAGVAGGATSIVIDPTTRGLEIVYRGVDLGTLAELRDSWTSPTATVSVPQKHLLVGLRAVSVAQGRQVLVTLRPIEGDTQTLYWNGHGLSQVVNRTSAPRLLSASKDELSFYVTAEASYDGLCWSKEIRELRNFAVTSPVPLTLQGDRLGHFGMGDIYIHRKPLLFGEYPPVSGDPVLRISDWRPDSLPEAVTNHSSAWLLYWAGEGMRSSVSWVQHGVVCQQESFGPTGRFLLRLYMPADHLETDMTGLHLRFPDDEGPLHGVAEVARRTSDELTTTDPRVRQVEQALNEGGKVGALTFMGVLMVTSATLVPVFGPASLVGGCGAALLVHLGEKSRSRNASANFLKHLEAWRKQMSEFRPSQP